MAILSGVNPASRSGGRDSEVDAKELLVRLRIFASIQVKASDSLLFCRTVSGSKGVSMVR